MTRGSDRRAAAALVAVAALYAIQGMVYGFASYVLIPRLSMQGVSLSEQTGILALAGAPWVLKLAWAPLVDGQRFGERPLWLARAASWAVGAVLLALSFVLPGAAQTQSLAWLWLLANVALSLLDVATDAFVLDAFAPQRRGLAGGVMLGSRDLGTHVVGGLGLGAVVGASGLVDGFVVLAAGVVALGLVTRAGPRTTGRQRAALQLAVLRELLGKPRSLVLGLVAALAIAADVATSAVSGDFLVQRMQWSIERITTELPLWLGVGTVLGYSVALVAVDRLGHARAAALGAAGLAAVWLGFAAIESSWMAEGVLQSMVVVQALPTSLLYAGLWAWLMDSTDPRIRATHFAVLMALLNLPRIIGPPLLAQVVEARGYGGAYLTAGVFEAVAAVVLIIAAKIAVHRRRGR